MRNELGDPVVVRLHHREVVFGVGVRDERGREAGSGVQHLGVHAVAVHFLEARRRLVAAGPNVLEPHPALHVFGRQTRARVHPEVDGIAHALDDPRVALVEVLDPRCAVAQRGRHPIQPEIGRFVHVAVGGDELIRVQRPVTLRMIGARPASVFAISITPFDAAGRIDEPGMRAHLRRLVAAGVGVYIGGGGSGEGFVLTSDERRRVLEIGADEVKGNVPFRSMGVETRSAQEMIEYARVAQAAGVDAAQIYSLDLGHGHLPTQAEIFEYLTDVLSSTTVPSVLSTHQSVGYRISVETITRIVDRFDHVIGVNSSHADLGYLAAIIDAVGDKVDVHVGGPLQALTALALGATGYLSSEANLAPRLCQSVITAYKEGNGDELFLAFGRLARLSMGCYGKGGIRATKAVLNRLGLPGGYPRKPQLPVDDATVDGLMTLIEDLGLRQVEGW